MTIRIAMWSGPRNLSTTMMRSFGARADTVCLDEPFYAPYLKLTGLNHPMRERILAEHETDAWRVNHLLGDAPVSAPIQYQKHMTHHMVADIPTDFIASCRHAFLIRKPERVLASYARKMTTASLEDIGFPQQAALFDLVCDTTGAVPPVIDADDILAGPERALVQLCGALDIDWDPAMLSWPAGPSRDDGAWAPHWYDAVWRSTGFGPPPGPLPELDGHLRDVARAADPIYARLAGHKLSD